MLLFNIIQFFILYTYVRSKLIRKSKIALEPPDLDQVGGNSIRKFNSSWFLKIKSSPPIFIIFK